MLSSVSARLQRLCLLSLTCLALPAFAATTAVDFGNVPVGTTSTAKTVTVAFAAAGTVKTITVGLLGSNKIDFFVSGGTCRTGASYIAGQSCTVAVTFAPSLPGERRGAVVLADASGAPLATTYMHGLGQGALPTFPPGGPVFIMPDAGDLGYAVDDRETIYYGKSGSPAVIYKHFPNGTQQRLATVPSQFGSPAIKDIDGAGNLILTSGNELLRMDPAGHFTVVAAIPPQSPGLRTIQLASAAAGGDGTVYAGANGYYFGIHPDGTFTSFFYTDKYGNPYFLNFAAVNSLDNAYYISAGVLLGTGMLTNDTNSLAIDASDTLLIDNDGAADEPCAVPYVGLNCHPGDPKAPFTARVLGLNDVRLGPNGNVYVTAPNGTAKALYRLNQLEPRGIVFASEGLSTSTAAFALTNSGNQPLDLSQLQLTLGGSSPNRFAIEKTNCSGSLAPAATCTASLSFTPNAAFPFTSFATLELNGLPGQSIKTVQLIGYLNQ